MTSKEALVELIVEAKSLNRNDSRLSFLSNEIEKDLEVLEIMSKYFGWLNFNNMEDYEKDKIMNYFLKKGEE